IIREVRPAGAKLVCAAEQIARIDSFHVNNGLSGYTQADALAESDVGNAIIGKLRPITSKSRTVAVLECCEINDRLRISWGREGEKGLQDSDNCFHISLKTRVNKSNALLDSCGQEKLQLTDKN